MSVPDRWEVIQVRLDEPLRPLSASENASGVYMVFWWNDIPLGHALARAGEFPLNETDILGRALRAIAPAVGYYSLEHGFEPPLPVGRQNRGGNIPASVESLVALSQPLKKLRTNPVPGKVPVSVIVCTHRRPERLRRCLAALQRLNPSPAEIIVVDNAPEERSTLNVVEEFDGVIHWPEPTLGLSRARNSGILRSSGKIVAFADDDVLVHPRWLHGVWQVFSEDNVFGMTGLVLAAELETRSQIRFELDFGGFNRGYRRITFDSRFFNSMVDRGVPVWHIGAGANMAFRREVFDRIGFFDMRLGPAGGAGCGDDSEFWYRMLAAGMSIVYEPRAVVWHAHRIDRAAFRSQMKQYMRGHVAALLVQFEKHRHSGNIHRLFTTLPYHYFRRLKRMRLEDDWSCLFGELLGCAWGFVTYFRQSLPGVFTSAGRTDPHKPKPISHTMPHRYKRALGDFLSNNPFPGPYTQGLFYREKMRAIHWIAPDLPVQHILEVGGGRSGLTSLLYPNAQITNIDLSSEYVSAPCNQRAGVHFVCGDATDLPFADETFDAVTMFDLLEHVPDHRQAVLEAFRVLRPGGFLLVSTPNENWRYPYYRFMKAVCPLEEELFAEWGHVRRGYSRSELEALVGFGANATASFINPLTVLCHDIGFSNLSWRRRKLCWALLGPITLAGYALHRPGSKGTETAYVWIKPQVEHRSEQRPNARSSPDYPLATASGEMIFDVQSNQ